MIKASEMAAGQQAGGGRYRKDIDGLRAVAVLPVLAYHAGVHAVSGGFVGVDVFFVISGYLITQVLLADAHAGGLSLVRFYDRRIRRILPALLVMLAGTTLVCLRYSLPSELLDYSKSLVAASLSWSNVYFWLSAGYFDAPALSKPLLHTWSLAVEEQFYILWPLYLMLGHRWFPRRLMPVTAAAAAASLALSAASAWLYPAAAFYLVPSRAWELLGGSLLALGALPRPLGSASRNGLAGAGLLLIAASALLIRPDLPFPGIVAIPPCLGTALVILAGRDGSSLVARLLAWRPIAFIGLISYSLYLWHWPVTVFQRNYSLLLAGHSERTQKLVIIACSLILAVLSWKFVEQPFRNRQRLSRQALFRWAALGTSCILALGLAGWGFQGFPGRLSGAEERIASYLDYDARDMFRVGQCFLTGREARRSFAPECLQRDQHRLNYLLLGDSHSAELWIGLQAAYGNINFLQATASDCFPVLHHALGEAPLCTQLMDEVLRRFLLEHPVNRVVLAARWKADYLDRIGETLQWLHQHHIAVTLIGPAVVYDSPLPRLMLTAARRDDAAWLDQHWDHSLIDLDRQLELLAHQSGADYISLFKLLCDGYACRSTDANGLPLLNDREHFTAEGSKLVAQCLKLYGLEPEASAQTAPPQRCQPPARLGNQG